MMKIINKNYIIESTKIKQNLKLVLLSDIHFSKEVSDKHLKAVLKNVHKQNPKYICIAGDIVDSFDCLLDVSEKCRLQFFLEELGKIASVFIILGNHDLTFRDGENYAEYDYFKIKDFFSTIQNITLIDNTRIELEEFDLYGFNKPYAKYVDGEKNQVFVNYKTDSQKFNLLLTHSPIKIIFNGFDLALMGHMHNGLVPFVFDKILKGNTGLIGPKRSLFPKNARGLAIINHTDTIISGGITKIGKSNHKIIRLFKNCFASEIDIICLSPSNKN